ncbi:MgtC/SapB family protein [uncultured Parasphingorhabdus sp.]|uniref:MgtC/SapB family protein n=1 Tax=uncultured Parasphingorhabdus sp. TaxID=2709694 RepID=UPI0030DD7254|tara:strand:- start:69264 stop:69719 length:456 start_codon:yes stop_codon:yes gene_type:complete
MDTEMGLTTIAMRLILACVLGGLIGIEREFKDRPAGLRTHILTSLAAALFTIMAIELSLTLANDEQNIQADPIRIIEAVTAGVAFLAAGTIITKHDGVSGLTTGAGMWLAGAIGIAVGAGYYAIAAMTTGLALVIFILLNTILSLMRSRNR